VGIHRRRLQAYSILQGYRDNSARAFMVQLYGESATDFEEDQQQRREYGEAKLIIE
jgi:hypothetical protein